jgi:methylated-DNA-[protein]-cysteine S-methyltransferase
MDFSEKVYGLARKIPKGRVTTYKEIAEKLGTKAYRAVGAALKNNRKLIAIPCHRVVNSDGRVGGYCGIKNNKKKIMLLKKEGVKIKGNRIINFENTLFRLK